MFVYRAAIKWWENKIERDEKEWWGSVVRNDYDENCESRKVTFPNTPRASSKVMRVCS